MCKTFSFLEEADGESVADYPLALCSWLEGVFGGNELACKANIALDHASRLLRRPMSMLGMLRVAGTGGEERLQTTFGPHVTAHICIRTLVGRASLVLELFL